MLTDKLEITLQLTQAELFLLRSLIQDKIDDANQLLDKTAPREFPNLRRQMAKQAARCSQILDQLPDQVNGWYLLPFDENGEPV